MKKFKTKFKFKLNVFTMQLIYLFAIILLAIMLLVIKPESIYIDILVIIIATLCSVYVFMKEIGNRKYRINELSKSVDIVLKDNLNKLNIPMVMLGNPTQIVWQNDLSKNTIPTDYIYDVALQLDNKFKSGEELKYELDIGNGTIYRALGSHISFSDFSCLIISFIDKTEENELRKIIDNTKVTVGVIFIDNYEETFQGLDEMEKGEITSKIDKILREFINDNNGIITKLDKDKYAIFIEWQYVQQLEKTKFAVLDSVKEITNKTKLPITISIGMSTNETELSERYLASSSALDIALGRGGDQVVIKKDKKFDFYGGLNIGLEKTSKVRARTIASALCDVIDKCDKVYIMGHKNTDVDCIGAAVGMHKITESLGKKSYIISDNKYNNSTKLVIDRVKTSDGYDDVFIGKDELKKHDFENSLLIIVDTHKKSYTCVPDIMDNFDKIVIIDHHRRGPEFINNAMLTYHELYASSTSELVTELLMYVPNLKLTKAEAECLYAGILIDTKNFSFKTGVRTFEVAAYLKRVGLDISEVKQIFQNDFETYLAKVEIVKNAEILDKQIAISICDNVYENMPTLAAQAADELLNISGILASFVLCKIDNVIMISSRSMGDINVQAIMEKIGGGGHLTFAGAQIAGITLDEAKTKVVEAIEEYFGKENKK
ncbi:MAG: DHH family phosphoesterase [Clostridia bacterium]